MTTDPLAETAPPPVAGRKTELASIQHLRAVAALGVVVWHAEGQMGLPTTTVLQAGIEVFFVISGFVMWLILDDRPVSPLTFLRKRLARIVPLYWLLTTLMVGLLLVAPNLLQSARLDPAHVLASYLFVAWPNPVPGVGLKPVMIPGWTLNYEMAFYGLLALCLCLPRRWRAASIIGALTGLAALSLLDPPPIAAFYASPFMAELALGVVLAIVMKRMRAFGWGGWALGIGSLALLAGGWVIDAQAHGRLLLLALPATLAVAGLVAMERAGRLPDLPPLKAIGDASYPLYMLHPVLLSALAQAWRAWAPAGASPWLYVVASLVFTTAVGWLAHIWMERPLIRFFAPSRARAATPPGLPAAVPVEIAG